MAALMADLTAGTGVHTLILGTGSAGCVLANRLSADPRRQVLLLEAGGTPPRASEIPANWPLMFNTAVDWGFHTAPQVHCQGRRLFWPRGRMLGGSGSLNAMIYMRGLPSDYDGWATMGCPGWGWQDVLPVFQRSECNQRFGDSDWHGGQGELRVGEVTHIDPVERLWLQAAQAAGLPLNDDFNGGHQAGVGLFQATIQGGERFGPNKAFLAPARSRPNLGVLTGVTVLRILFDGQRASGVAYLQNGRLHTVHAEQIVLCAGAIGSPHLLLHSGIGPADELAAPGIPPRIDLPGVGRHLQDHVNCSITVATSQAFGIAMADDAARTAHQAEWDQSRSGPLSSNWSACGGFARVGAGAGEPDLQTHCIVSPHRDHGRYQGSTPGMTLFSVLQRPDSQGRLWLQSADPPAPPLIDPDYFSDDGGDDLTVMAAGIRLNRQILAQSPIRELITGEWPVSAHAHSDPALADYIGRQAATLYHPTSTCRMGSYAMAVVDPQLRVRSAEGLWVADASVFPKMVSGNTNAPVIMVAERAAEMMLAAA